MAHASSSNIGPFLEKRGYIQVPEQVNCSFVFSNWAITVWILLCLDNHFLFATIYLYKASTWMPLLKPQMPNRMSCFIDLMGKIISSMEIINIVTDIGSSLGVFKSDVFVKANE